MRFSKILPFLTLTGVLALVMYGISRTIFASQLVYLIDNATGAGSELAFLITTTNTQDKGFVQKDFNADVLVNGKLISTIKDSEAVSIPAMQVVPQGFIIDLPADQIPGGTLRLIRVQGTVTVDNIPMPLDLKYKFI